MGRKKKILDGIAKSKQSVLWCATWNNYPDDYRDIIQSVKDELEIVYWYSCQEIAPTTSTPHLQCFFKTKKTNNYYIINKLPNIWVEPMMKPEINNQIYCSKTALTDEDVKLRVYTFGHLPYQGERSDLVKMKKKTVYSVKSILKDIKDENLNMRNIVEKCNTLSEIKVAELAMKYHEKPREFTFSFKFIYIYGASGVGKTKYANRYFQEHQCDVYRLSKTTKWFDGYDSHPVLFMDEFRSSTCSYSELLKITQSEAHLIEIKGNMRQLKATKVVITSSMSPLQLYPKLNDSKYQLLRRITSLIHIKTDSTVEDETSKLRQIQNQIRKDEVDMIDMDIVDQYEFIKKGQFMMDEE